jgi:hypothetical protein
LLSDAYVADAERAEYKLKQAQVEATLALAYEQRTASIIAWQSRVRRGSLVSVIEERLALPDQIE